MRFQQDVAFSLFTVSMVAHTNTINVKTQQHAVIAHRKRVSQLAFMNAIQEMDFGVTN